MKQVSIILVFLISIVLTGCKNNEPQYVDIDVHVQAIECIEFEENMYAMTLQEYATWEETFLVEKVELLTSDKFVFPYETETIEKHIDDYKMYIQAFFDDISDQELMGSAERLIGPKAKLIITLTSGNYIIQMNFYDNDEGEFIKLEVEFYDDENYLSKVVFEDDYTDVLLDFQQLIQ